MKLSFSLKKILGFLTGTAIMIPTAMANLKLPAIFTDGMVLQRNVAVPIWGWSNPGEKVTVKIADNTYNALSDESGNWKVAVGPLKSGGPYVLSVEAGNQKLLLNDVLVGEVWLASGQSNMEWQVGWLPYRKDEINKAKNSKIRMFTVPHNFSSTPEKDILPAKWLTAEGENVATFSAVAYFFAQQLYDRYRIPVGIITSSWGGTIAETWMSEGAIRNFSDLAQPLATNEFKEYNLKKADEAQEKVNQRIQTFVQNDIGMQQHWFEPSYPFDGQVVMVPGKWESYTGNDFNGIGWYKKSFLLNVVDDNILLHLGKIDDWDEVWINGVSVGKTNSWDADRVYEIPQNILKIGENFIVVKVTDTGGDGGFYSEPKDLYLRNGKDNILLSGEWQFKKGLQFPKDLLQNQGPNRFPTICFNGMIAPIRDFAIKGVIWYQGESNAERAFRYRSVFQALINDWRGSFGKNMPFLFVQLANFKKADKVPTLSEWAELREAQTMALTLPNTGMATAIDIGDAMDIHPTNKQEVGRRLFLAAQKVAYGEDVVALGPSYESMKIDGNEIRIKFDNETGGLLCTDKYGYVKGFQIAGNNQKFYWAKARIEGQTVIVHSENVKSPVAVRYGWADNPDDCNLYNLDNLPAIPFRTDNWLGLTDLRQ